MAYTAISGEHISYFNALIGSTFVFSDKDALTLYSRDYTEDLSFMPELVLKPGNTAEISAILAYCNQCHIPVTPRGAGTGLSGGSLPVHGGISLSLERLNRIIEIDDKNLQAIVEPGVINEVFQQAVKDRGLFYPPDPASKGSCFLGGNIAHSSGGPKAVKYGTTKDYVLNLEVVLANGDIIWTGADTLKNSTGYNLTQLFIGSEGTLGVVTKIVFKLLPLPEYNLLMLASFSNAVDACAAVPQIFHRGIVPSAMEFMERRGVEMSVSRLGLPFEFGTEQAYLLIEVDGNNMDILYADCESINEVLENNHCLNVMFADDSETKERFWRIRRAIGETVKSFSIYKEEDTVVRRASLPVLFEQVKAIGEKYGFESVCYGHAGDGNLHVNILKGDLSQEFWDNELSKGITEIFEVCKRLGGTISGEHGIGLVQKPYLGIVFSPAHFQLMRGIKQVFDPNLILNPGKIFDRD